MVKVEDESKVPSHFLSMPQLQRERERIGSKMSGFTSLFNGGGLDQVFLKGEFSAERDPLAVTRGIGIK